MASKANQRRDEKSGVSRVITRLCSINSTGLIFVSRRRLGLSAEVSLKVETKLFGLSRTWELQGWVVECRAMSEPEGKPYQITLLFSDIPKGLQEALTLAGEDGVLTYPSLDDAGMFGKN